MSPKRSCAISISDLFCCFSLIAITLLIYYQVHSFDFINLDDHLVYENPAIQAGLTTAGAKWAFSNMAAGQWIPLVWLSYMLDVQIYGFSPGGFHVTNVIFHIINVLLLFSLAKGFTKKPWESGIVAAFLAVHPMHVESVAWIAERKDVLCMFFFLSTIIFYVRYVKTHNNLNYILSLFIYCLALMAKPMVVTLPVILIFLDIWPLNRSASQQCPENKSAYSFLYDKIPYGIAAFIISMMTFYGTKQLGGITDSETLAIYDRIATVLVSYSTYIINLLFPLRLSVFYPYQQNMELYKPAASLCLLTAISFTAIKFRSRMPYIFMGWFWYLVTFIPVIGIVQAGTQSHADRFTYIPFIGLYFIIALGLNALFRRYNVKKAIIILFFLTVFSGLIFASHKQTGYWKNSLALFSRAAEVTRDNCLAYECIGKALTTDGRFKESIPYYLRILENKPQNIDALINIGMAYYHTGKKDRAIEYLLKAISIVPDADAHNNLGLIYYMNGDLQKAEHHFNEVLKIDPNHVQAKKHIEHLKRHFLAH